MRIGHKVQVTHCSKDTTGVLLMSWSCPAPPSEVWEFRDWVNVDLEVLYEAFDKLMATKFIVQTDTEESATILVSAKTEHRMYVRLRINTDTLNVSKVLSVVFAMSCC